MKKKLVFGIVSVSGSILLSLNAFGQVGDEGFFTTPIFQFSPQFFMAVLAGVLLAIGFQLVLANLSIAAGVTVIGNIRKKAHKSGGGETSDDNKSSGKSGTPAGVKFMSAAGAWGMITTAVSLFFASLLAVKLSLVPDNIIGVTLGLVIWAVFFMTLLYLEAKALGNVLSGTFSTAVKAVKAGATSAGALFSKSESSKIEKVAEHSIDKVKEDLGDYIEDLNLDTRINDYLNKIKPSKLNLEDLKDEFAELINEIKVEEKQGEGGGDKELFLRVAEKQPRFSRKDIHSLSKYYDTVKSALKVSGALGGVGGTASVLAKTPPAQKLKHDIEEYLRKTGEPEFQPEVLKAELDEIFRHPASATEIIKNKAKAFDKETVVSAVTAKQGVSREEALKVADKVEEAIDKVRGNVQANIETVETKAREAKDKVVGAVKEKQDVISHSIENRIKNFLDKVDRPELNYLRLKLDMELLLKHPKLAPKILRAKLKEFDEETLVAFLAANDNISKTEAENIVAKFEDAKANVMIKLEQAENEVKKRLDQSKEFALKQAENTRETAVAASWWLFGTLVISGIAAILGGILAL